MKYTHSQGKGQGSGVFRKSFTDGKMHKKRYEESKVTNPEDT